MIYKKRKLIAALFTIIISSLVSGCTAASNTQGQVENESVVITETLPTQETTPEAGFNAPPTGMVQYEQNSSAGDSYMPEIGNQGYDVQHYAIQITLDPSTYYLEATNTIDLVTTMDDLTQISLDFAGLEISNISVNGKTAAYFREGKKLYIDLPSPASTGEQMQISISYAGEPLQEISPYVPFVDHLGIQYTESMAYIVSEPDGARYWMPVNDHPLDKATYDFKITVPEAYVAVSNGHFVDEVSSDGQSTYTWKLDDPAASSMITIAVGDYVRVESTSPKGVILRSYVTPGNQAAFEEMQPAIGEMIDWMGEQFGTYPFDEFGYVEVSDIGASLETQTMVIMSQASLLDEQVLAHEMAHMWFGDYVSLESWGDIWRNEGFATYVSFLWATRDNPQNMEVIRYKLAKNIEENPSGHALANPPAEEMFGSDSYYKGALLVYDLRKEMGDDAFFKGLRNYFEQYGGGAASREEFTAVMEAAAGTDLVSITEQWDY
jgi:aminopeptidase N